MIRMGNHAHHKIPVFDIHLCHIRLKARQFAGLAKIVVLPEAALRYRIREQEPLVFQVFQANRSVTDRRMVGRKRHHKLTVVKRNECQITLIHVRRFQQRFKLLPGDLREQRAFYHAGEADIHRAIHDLGQEILLRVEKPVQHYARVFLQKTSQMVFQTCGTQTRYRSNGQHTFVRSEMRTNHFPHAVMAVQYVLEETEYLGTLRRLADLGIRSSVEQRHAEFRFQRRYLL